MLVMLDDERQESIDPRRSEYPPHLFALPQKLLVDRRQNRQRDGLVGWQVFHGSVVVIEGDFEDSLVVILGIRRNEDEGAVGVVVLSAFQSHGGSIGGCTPGELRDRRARSQAITVIGGGGRCRTREDFGGGGVDEELRFPFDHPKEEFLELRTLLLLPSLEGVVRVKVFSSSWKLGSLCDVVDTTFEVDERGLFKIEP